MEPKQDDFVKQFPNARFHDNGEPVLSSEESMKTTQEIEKNAYPPRVTAETVENKQRRISKIEEQLRKIFNRSRS